MIEPMKKYSFLVYHKEYHEFLEGIRELGVLHVIEKESGEIEDEEIREKYQKLNQLNEAIKFLSKRDVEPEKSAGEADAFKVLDELQDMRRDQEEYIQRLAHLNKEKNFLEPWGDFSWETIEKLNKTGYQIDFYQCPSRYYNPEWEENYDTAVINEQGGQKYFVVLHKPDESVEVDAENALLPRTSLSKIAKNIQEIESILGKAERLYDKLSATALPALSAASKELRGELDFSRVVLSTQKEADDKLRFLEGWVPENKSDNLEKFLNEHGLYYESENPVPKDNVPVLLKNKPFPRLFEGISKLYSLPNYRELDLTPFFAPFFMLFFGFCLGDAGYGLLFVIGASLYKLKADESFKPILTLAQFLGLATVIFGALTGTIFGINLIDSGYTITEQSLALLQQQHVPAEIINQLQTLVGVTVESKTAFQSELANLFHGQLANQYEQLILKYTESDYAILNSFRYLLLDPNQMFTFALILGAIQIIFGMMIRAANQIRMFGIRYAFSTIGWLVLILGGAGTYALSTSAVLDGKTAKILFFVVLGISSLGIYFFNDPKRNVLINVGAGLWDTYNMITGVLGDLLSYIRLFALGISSAILGFVFNDLAINMSPDLPVARQLVFVIILLIGHGINIFMSSLGSFVHPLRLTFVEFYKNAGFMGGGKKYNPFSK